MSKKGTILILASSILVILLLSIIFKSKLTESIASDYSSAPATKIAEVEKVEIDGVDITKVDYSTLDTTFKADVYYSDGTVIRKSCYKVYDDKLSEYVIKYEDKDNNYGRIVISTKGVEK